MRNTRLAVVLALMIAAPPYALYAQHVDTTAWLQDFEQLKQAMAAHYANLEWAVTRRGMDLKQLAATTAARLRDAGTDADARRAIESFLGAFGDGHLEIQWPTPDGAPASSRPPTAARAPVRPACRALGYRSTSVSKGLGFALLPHFRPLTTADSPIFAIGVLQVPGGRPVGVLRIALFSGQPFPDLCEQAATARALAADAPCDSGCLEQLEVEARNRLTAALERQIAALERQNVRALVVDLTHNGGGSEWVEVAARPLTSHPLRDSPMGFVRHPHWVGQLADRLARVEADTGAATGHIRELLRQAANVLRRQLAEARRACPQGGRWEDERPACELLVTEPPLYPAGVLRYARADSLPPGFAPSYLFDPLRYVYHEGVYRGPLMVVVDRETASAAEEFAALLADNGAATILGEPTYGAGCGYTNGGIPTTLEHSRGDVRMPDCVRFRADGANEVEGITPDVLIPWRGADSPLQKARRFEAALPAAVSARPRHP